MARQAIPVATPAILPDFFANCTAASATSGNSVDGMEIVNDGRTLIVVQNGHTSSVNITPKGVADENGRIQDPVHAVTNGEFAIIVLPKPSIWAQSSGKTNIDQSAGGNAVKYWAFRLP